MRVDGPDNYLRQEHGCHILCGASGLRWVCGVPSRLTSRPFCACFTNMPVEHDGTNAFKFRVAFREAIKIDFRIFWDHSLTESLCPYRGEFCPEAYRTQHSRYLSRTHIGRARAPGPEQAQRRGRHPDRHLVLRSARLHPAGGGARPRDVSRCPQSVLRGHRRRGARSRRRVVALHRRCRARHFSTPGRPATRKTGDRRRWPASPPWKQPRTPLPA